MANVFLLEDEPNEQTLFVDRVRYVDATSTVTIAGSLEEAMEVLHDHDPDEFDLVVIDLRVPNGRKTPLGYDIESGRLNGLEAAREARRIGYRTIIILSQFSDDKQVDEAMTKAEAEGFTFDGRLRKEADIRSDEDFRAYFQRYLIDWEKLRRALADKGIYTVGRQYIRVLKELTEFVWDDLERPDPPLPVLVLEGARRSGKARWASALPTIKEFLLRVRFQVADSSLPDFPTLSHDGLEFSDYVGWQRRFVGERSVGCSTDGPLVYLTAYGGECSKPILANGDDVFRDLGPIRDRCGYIVLRGVAPSDGQWWTLWNGVVTSGLAIPAGGRVPIKVGCAVVLTAGSEWIAGGETVGVADDPGRFHCRRIRLPDFDDLSFEEVLDLVAEIDSQVRGMAGRTLPKLIGAGAKRSLYNAHAARKLDVGALVDIVRAYQRDGLSRIADTHVSKALVSRVARSDSVQGPSHPVQEGARACVFKVPASLSDRLGEVDFERAFRVLQEVVTTQGCSVGRKLDTALRKLSVAQKFAFYVLVYAYTKRAELTWQNVESWLGESKDQFRTSMRRFREGQNPEWRALGTAEAIKEFAAEVRSDLPPLVVKNALNPR